jgi:hypothetical protein
VPEHIARLMSEEDRKKLGIMTADELAAQSTLILEREIHSQFSSWLYRNGFEDFYHSDPVRRPTIKAGLPDFGIYRNSRILFIEFKVRPNGLSPVQEETFARMGNRGNVILVCYTYEQAVKATETFFQP